MTTILGGHCTDFARNAARDGKTIGDLMTEAVHGALADARIDARDIGVVHVGNFTAELFADQGQLGGLVAALPGFDGVPSARHEAACASGSVAVLAAMADLEAGRYETALVVGVELMRNVPGDVAARHLGVAALAGEADGARYLWPALFDEVLSAYRARHGVERRHLVQLARQGYVNARSNMNAQTRIWTIDGSTFAEADTNPVVHGALRRGDCAQVTDGACAVVLGRGVSGPIIKGWGHRTAPIALADKLARAPADGWMFPRLRRTIVDARAGRHPTPQVDALEIHDCFSITGYIILDHLGLAPPGNVGRLIDQGHFAPDGPLPVNLSGGLVGMGHPVGATGVRMLLDAARLVRDGRRAVQTLNVGGSFTTTVSFVVGA